MIIGHGIDLQDMEKVRSVLSKKPDFASKILTANELAVYAGYPAERQLSYLAGRWAAKEAFSKAYGTGLMTGLRLTDLEILSDDKGKPIFTQSPFAGRVWVSISHSGNFAQASVILEGGDHDS